MVALSSSSRTAPMRRVWVRVGRLTRLLPRTAVKQDGVFLSYPRGASMAPKPRGFIDLAKVVLKSG